jgi:polyisoprenoid-binding protein YceI
MNLRAAAAVSAALIAAPVAAEETYVIDPVHSQPQWVARHIGFSNQHGNFGKASGKIVLDRAAQKGSIDVTIDATSIRTYSDRLMPWSRARSSSTSRSIRRSRSSRRASSSTVTGSSARKAS